MDTLFPTSDNTVEDDLDVELAEGGGDFREVPGQLALLARLQRDPAVAAVRDAAVG